DSIGTSDAWIVRRTGIHQRRWLAADESVADLATSACAEAIKQAGVSAGELTHVVVATITADRVTPGVGVEVADRLGAEQPAAFDVHAACSGFLYALDHACALIESDRAEHVLVCGAEALSRITDHTDRGTAILLGDGAGAVVVSRVADAVRPCFSLGSDGSQIELLYADRFDRLLRMHGTAIYEYAIRAMTAQTRLVLERCQLDVTDLDLFIAHQANARILKSVAGALGLPEDRLFVNLDKVANTSAASIPLAMSHALEQDRIAPGALLGMAAFGAGVSWGAGVISYRPAGD
ncbi:MAG: beta-ketoacyl-ACP synthase 3, partial [Actinomycetota bacterium]|nr:beta-ketoacyl-ACP synthase 3 [Actinomycetota bacterium]